MLPSQHASLRNKMASSYSFTNRWSSIDNSAPTQPRTYARGNCFPMVAAVQHQCAILDEDHEKTSVYVWQQAATPAQLPVHVLLHPRWISWSREVGSLLLGNRASYVASWVDSLL